MSSAVVLSSGGINSTTVLEIALRAHRPDTVYMVSFEYESKYNEQERLASLDLYSYYTDKGENVTLEQVEITGPNVTPFLDGILLSRAAAYAITKGASYIYTGMQRDGTSSDEFLNAMAEAMHTGSNYKIRLRHLLVPNGKANIIKRAYELEVPINLTWSCTQPVPFKDGSGYIHCGVCLSCKERIAGFDRVSVIDPIAYAVGIDWYPMYKSWPYIGEKQLRAGKL